MRSFGDRARHYFWKDFKSYRFADYPLVPQEIEEQQLEELLREFLFRNH
jgi:hypothetical protein